MASRISIAILLAGLALSTLPAAAQQVGTATAVNPLSESTPPGGATTTLNVGAHIVHNERIHTTPTGSAQLLFTDHSSMSVSANADIVIDEYVYDPSSGSGHMLATLSKGALRYVGGQLSHQGEATVATPLATIGIRGGTATIVVGPRGVQVTDHAGFLTIQNNAGTMTIKRPGFTALVQSLNALPTALIRVTDAQTNVDLQIMSKPGQNGGVPGLKSAPVSACAVGAVPGNLPGNYNCPNPPWINTDSGESDAAHLIEQANEHATTRIQQPPPRIRGR